MGERGAGPAGDVSRADALRALAWLRERSPEARITTTLIPSDEAFVAVRVEIETDGEASSAHGSALAIEEAEDRGIIRAAEGLGYRRDDAHHADAPDSTIVQLPSRPQSPPPRAGRSAEMGPAVMVRPRQPPSAPTEEPPGRPAASGSPPRQPVEMPVSDPELEGVSWTEFWRWARAQGFNSGEAVADAIGRPMEGLTPREVRTLLRERLGEER